MKRLTSRAIRAEQEDNPSPTADAGNPAFDVSESAIVETSEHRLDLLLSRNRLGLPAFCYLL
jgi:hypothetical protein